MQQNFYQTLAAPVTGIFWKERKSKFFGYAYPVDDEEEIKQFLNDITSQHRTANHLCYAWQLGNVEPYYRAHDDGEPNNSAGMPIYGQIQAFNLTQVLVAVARIFGGTKLGVGGLMQAYRETAKLTLQEANIITVTVMETYQLVFDYQQMNQAMSLIKKFDAQMMSQVMGLQCQLIVKVGKDIAAIFEESLRQYHKIDIKKRSSDQSF